jgi:DNA modification methylase
MHEPLAGELGLALPLDMPPPVDVAALRAAREADAELLARYQPVMAVDARLNRSLVSYQSSREERFLRWYKYKEAFSSSLVRFLLSEWNVRDGCLLDPFAGSGTALFAARDLGVESYGIELLPIGQEIILARHWLEEEFRRDDWARLRQWAEERLWRTCPRREEIPELRITRGAYPPETEEQLTHYWAAMGGENKRVARALRFAVLCVAEAVSYTRKDGQYLRWDCRSGRGQGIRPFDKGAILDFETAVAAKIAQFDEDVHATPDLSLFEEERRSAPITLMGGSCLALLPKVPDATYSVVMTSPPYCNRYDYTRTYALELALLGLGESDVSHLRQQMLTCTVENKTKDLLGFSPAWDEVAARLGEIELLQAIVAYLDDQRRGGRLNNPNIVRMVRGYFQEMGCVIWELARVLRPGGLVFMVNDNVRYAGLDISVDLLLAETARLCGLTVERIMILPNGKGNSSQQMGEHGRVPLRKCVYVWRKV